MTATAAAIKRLDDLFQNIRLENEVTKNGAGTGRKSTERVHFNPIVVTKDCDIHGKNLRGSQRNGGGSIGRSMPSGLDSIRRAALNSAASRENVYHPSSFASTLRHDNGNHFQGCTNPQRRADVGAAKKEPASSTLTRSTHVKRGSGGDTTLASAANGNNGNNGKKEQNGSQKRDYVSGDRGASPRKELLQTRRFSTDSLDSVRRNSWDTNRRESSGSSAGFEDPIWEENNAGEVNA
ncbi:hypothetical protein V9T40_010470 [Parthenolecanium corni]|uniref:Uncharacterized protein n=1 Tax=Parthenolecanium corni TaxID=536013 RepID=A0AAN9TCS1_9HEMI